MSYITENEINNFIFDDAHVNDWHISSDTLTIGLDNVIIKPECSKNRDIRQMRCNEMTLKLVEFTDFELIEEGYKIYNPDGVLMNAYDDKVRDKEDYDQIFASFIEGYTYSITCEPVDDKFKYSIVVDDAEAEHTYTINLIAKRDVEAWEKFLNI